MTSFFVPKPHSRKPLSRIYVDANQFSHPEHLLSNLPDYFSLLPIKKRYKPSTKPSLISPIYNLRSRNQKENIEPKPKHPQTVPEYLNDILTFYLETDRASKILYGYMDSQSEINMKMRGILIDWLVDVHLKFKLTPETLYITVNLIDKYLYNENVQRTKLQLVGITCLFIACKYEEIYPPELKDHVYITDQTYTKEEIIKMEESILKCLNFNITFPTALRYLEIFTETLNNGDENITNTEGFMFSRYLIELSLVEYTMLKYTNGEIAISAYYISYKMNNEMLCSLERIAKAFGYDQQRIKECSKDICTILDNAESYWLHAVKKKFSLEQYKNVANWKKFILYKSNTK